jgi:hypothetical protein
MAGRLGRLEFHVVTGQDAFDGQLSALRDHVGDLGARLAIWSARDDGRPDAHARRCANDAMDAIDAALRDLRARLVGEIRASDDAAAPRVDALLRGRGDQD